MKKIWFLMPMLAASLILGACGGNKKPVPSEDSEPEVSEPAESDPVEESEEEESEEPRVYYVVGSFNGWTQKDPNYVMTADPEDSTHYTFEGLELAAEGELKCMDSENHWYPDGMGNNEIVEENGVYTVDLHTFEEEELVIVLTKTADWEPPVEEFYICGSFNGWGDAAGVEEWKMEEDAETAGLYTYELDLEENGTFKVVGKMGDALNWYGIEGADVNAPAGMSLVKFVAETHAIEVIPAN